MTGIKGYLLGVVLSAVFCTVLLRLTGTKHTSGKIIRLLAGLFMTAAVLHPLISLDITDFTRYPVMIAGQGDAFAQDGTKMAEDAMDAIIISQTQAYILDKAASMGAVLEVSVTLQEHIPYHVQIRGPISPGAKARLTEWIRENLNIPVEEQQWN
jgi:hypothetical protein